MPKFLASAPYGDCDGTAAADRVDAGSLGTYLREKGLLGADEFLVALEMQFDRSHEGSTATFRALAVRATGFEEAANGPLKMDPVPVRVINVSLSFEQILARFKHISVTLTMRGADLQGRDYREI